MPAHSSRMIFKPRFRRRAPDASKSTTERQQFARGSPVEPLPKLHERVRLVYWISQPSLPQEFLHRAEPRQLVLVWKALRRVVASLHEPWLLIRLDGQWRFLPPLSTRHTSHLSILRSERWA